MTGREAVGAAAWLYRAVTGDQVMAALKVRAGDLTMVDFIPMQETRAALEQFINDRGLAND